MKIKKKSTLIAILMSVLLCLSLMPMTAFAEPGDVAIDVTNFPDSTFRAYVSANFDTNNDGILSQSELDAVTEIDVSDKHIPTLKGVEHFKKLKNLNCGYNQLTALDVSHNPALETLLLPDNALSAIDVSHNSVLKELFCRYNQLTALDVSHNPALQALECDNNQLTALDVSHNPALTDLDCGYNRLTALDVSHNPELTELYCDSNKLTVLDVSHNPALKKLGCFNIELTTLDLSKNSALEYLVCTGNELTAIDVSHNPELTYLDCDRNQLTAIDVSHNPALKKLNCMFNKLTTLDVSHNPALTGLTCNFNQLTAIDVSHNPELTYLNCSYNQLTNLDVSHNPALQDLACYENRLTNLDLTANPLIKAFHGYDQEFDITLGKNMMTFDLKSLPGNFDPSKASGWAGASVSGNTLKLDSTKPSKVTYTYEARPGRNLSVTLNISHKDEVKISFDKNGGSGSMADVTKKAGETYVLPACEFTAPVGKEFKAWEVGGVEKAPNDSITVNANTTVKALWKDKAVIPVAHDVNIAPTTHGTVTADKAKAKKGETVTLTITPDNGYVIDEINVMDDGASNVPVTNNKFTMPDRLVNVTVTFKAKPVTPGTNPGTPNPGTNPGTPGITPTVEKFMITVDPSGGNWNGSTAAKSYEIEKGQYLTLPAAPTKDGYTFLYWKGSKYQPGDKYLVEGNHTFTAVWQKKPVKIASDATAPKTGDNAIPYVYTLGLIMAACGMLVLNTRRSKNK
ncbi:InlB B-repeat-containing protein [Murdochiella vaginalis]|uniref:InlB B-repeat-containing protein n=1 Tax=Murdochiella vaginalis TaxID=1852373 RepID=UPI0008FDBBE4|nr:InlB B-repeat-containing protein [Murdochiella vaginalis]